MTLYKYAGEPLNGARLERTREFLLNHGLRMEDDADYWYACMTKTAG